MNQMFSVFSWLGACPVLGVIAVSAGLGLGPSRAQSAKPLECPPPQYPSVLHNVEGRVDLEAVVAPDGSVQSVKVLTRQPNTALAEAASDALQRWRFEPAAEGHSGERTYSTPFYFTPPDGVPLQLGVEPPNRSRLQVDGNTVSLSRGRDWILSVLILADFELTGDVRIPDRADAGLVIRSWSEDGRRSHVGYRIALGNMDDATGKPGTLSSSGQLSFTTTTFDPGASDAYRRTSSAWQPIKVMCLDRSLQVFFGDRLVTNAQLLDEFTGRIGFDVPAGTLEFRNLRVRRLDQHRLSVPLSVRFPDAVLGTGSGIVMPVPTRSDRPQYTRRAMKEHVTGVVTLEILIEEDGSVGRVRLTGPLHDELDARAVSTVRRWRFKPAYRNGQAVRSLADVQLSFEL